MDHHTRVRAGRRHGIACSAIVLALAGGIEETCLAQSPPQYEVTAVLYGPECSMPPGPASVKPWGLSDDGQIVGYYYCPAGYDHAFIWPGQGPIVPIPMPPGTYLSRAHDINSDGWVTGYYEADAHNGFLYDGTTTITLEMPPGAVWLEPMALNDARQVVGYWQWGHEAFLWNDGQCTDLSAILPGSSSNALDVNNAGMISGWAGQTSQQDARAFIIQGEVLTLFDPIPGGLTSEAKAITGQGHFAGLGVVEEPGGQLVVRALYWDGAEMFNLGTLPGKSFSRAYDMNEDDVIVGTSSVTPTGQPLAFMWRDGVMYDLNDLADTGAIELHVGKAINASGQIVCSARDFSLGCGVAVLLTPLPSLSGDLDGNGVVNVIDLLLLLGAWGPCAPPPGECPADLNGSGEVDTLDLLILLGNWTVARE